MIQSSEEKDSGYNTYNDPIKQESREKQRNFIERNLLSFKKPKEVNVVCFPGAEIDGEEALEVKEVYDALGIPRLNIVGLEADSEKADRLRNANLGITIENKLDLDFFKNTSKKFDIISLDYTGYRDEPKWQTIHLIAGRQLLYGNGILCTNYSARRESLKYQAQMLTLQADSILGSNDEDTQLDSLESLISEFQNGKKMNLSELRDALTHRTLMIMRMGTSALKSINLLTTHPAYDMAQAELKKIEEKSVKESKYACFYLKNRYDSGMENKGATHPLSCLYRDLHMELLSEFIKERNGITKNLASFLTNYFVDLEIQGQFPRTIERYSYVSNKNATMEMDLIAFTSTDRLYRKLNGKVSYDTKSGKITIGNIKGKRLFKIWEEIYNQKHGINVPERIYLGSSWKPAQRKEKISKDDAIDLLRNGCTPQEVAECYKGYSKMQLAAFKAHYVTMGKEIK